MINKNLLTNDVSEDWRSILEKEFNKNYFEQLLIELNKSFRKNILLPAPESIFNAFNKTSFTKLKMVILGQDPYHGEKQANGLCFAVNRTIQTPPSLRNILSEIYSDTNELPQTEKNLEFWAQQGVLLLNTSLTVERNNPNSHSHIGWNKFTDEILWQISNQKKNIVFFLWGNNAKQKKKLLNIDKHLILSTSHPSPLSVYRGFKGCKHFSKANEYLENHGIKKIIW